MNQKIKEFIEKWDNLLEEYNVPSHKIELDNEKWTIRDWIQTDAPKVKYPLISNGDIYKTYPPDFLKFISRGWQLNDLLMAMNKKKCMLSIDEDGCLREIPDGSRISNGEYLPTIDHTKSLLNQESLTEIIKVLQ